MNCLLLLSFVYVCSYAGVGESESPNPGINTSTMPFSDSKEECNRDEIPEREQSK